MKVIIASVLVVLSMAAAEPPSRFRHSARQSVAPGTFQPPAPQIAPYNPRGWRPQGAALTLPKSQPQQAYGPPSPKPSYGPPPEEPTTTEYNIIESTEPPQVGKLSSKATNKAPAPAKQQQSSGSYYVVLPQSAVVVTQPQSQNLVYAVAEVQKSSPLVATVPQATILAAAPLTSSSAQLQALPVTTPLKAVYSPYVVSYNSW